jgi:hypothetical protein
MNDLRFRINVPRAGSAARLSEEENALQPGPRTHILRPRAGSSALESETRKREEDRLQGTAGFTMRAQNGRIVRTERDLAAPVMPAADPTKTEVLPTPRAESDAHSTPQSSPEKIHTTQRSLAPSLLGTLAGRLNSAVHSLLGTSTSPSASDHGDD